MSHFPSNLIDLELEAEASAPESPFAALHIAWKRLGLRERAFIGTERAA